MGSKLAHLDILSSNIMLRKEGYSAWDQLRLLDFGFARHCSEVKMLCLSLLLPAMPCSKTHAFLNHALQSCQDPPYHMQWFPPGTVRQNYRVAICAKTNHRCYACPQM